MSKKHLPTFHTVTVVDRAGRNRRQVPVIYRSIPATDPTGRRASKYNPATEDRKHAVLPASRRMQQAWKRVQRDLKAMAGIGV